MMKLIATVIKNLSELICQNLSEFVRIMKTSETAVDHILTNTILDFEVHSGIIKNDISDHFGIFCVLKTDLERKSNNEYFLRRDICDSNVKKFKALMNTVDWNLIT